MEKPHKPCPYSDCGSSDAFSWNSEGYGKCHSCGKSYPGKGDTFEWAESEYPVAKRKETRVNIEIDSTTYEGIRGLDSDVAQLYGIQRQLDAGGEWVRDAFKYPSNVKYRTPDKKFFWKNKGVAPVELFGPDFNAGTSKKIYLTEGEYDAASLFQILGKTFPVKAIPSASIGDKFVKHNHPYLSSFEQIVYAGELDDAGKGAAERLYQAYPEKFWFVPMTKWKDANEFLTNGDGDELMWAARKPQRYSPDNFFCSDEEVAQAILTENPYEYIPTGHSGIDGKVRGLVKGGITFIKAPRGIGKTSLIRYFEVGVLRNSTAKVAMLHMEEQRSTTYRAMASYELEKNVNTREDAKANGVSEEEVVKAAQAITQGERTIVFEMRSHDEPMKVLEYIKLAAGVYGAEVILIDHIQRLAYLSDGGVDNATSMLTKLAAQSAQLAKELNICIIFISQVNENNRTKYASALEEEAFISMLLERDVTSEDETIRNTTKVIIDKNRPYAAMGDAGGLFYDSNTTLVSELDFDV